LLGLAALADQLAKWSRLLRSTSRSAPARHQTLQATLEWSHSLLDAREQLVLRRLAAFAGSFRVEPALQAVAVDGLDHWDVLDVLTALVDKSLVQVERLEPPRYRLLETMRMFAAEQLAQHDETAQALQRHGEAMASLAEQVERAFWETADRPWLARHAPDYDDLQVAFDRACQRQDADVAARTGSALLRLDHLRNINAPRRARAEALYRLVPHASLQARAWIWSCIASHGLIALDVVSRLDASGQAVAAWRQLGDRARLHFALGFHAAECARAHDFEAADRALAEARALEDADWPLRRRMWGASARAGVCIHRGDAAGYREASRIELALAERAGAERAAAWARLKLADAALMAGDHDEAIELGRLAVAELHELDQPSNLGLALSNLCAALLLSGNDEPAREAAAQALPLTWRSGWGYLVLDSVALLAARDGRAELAAQLLGHVDAWYAAHGDERQPNEALLARRAAEAIEAVVGARQAATLRAAGSALTEAEAEALAGAVLRRADAADSGRPPRLPR
jgi:tetratricopeptide (TPR) repeat protein